MDAERRHDGPAPQRVLMTADTVGGVWTYALDLARGLGERGVEVTIAALGGLCSPAQREEAAAVPRLTVYESGFRLEWMPAPWDDVRTSIWWLRRLEEDVRPDVVHLNTFSHGAVRWRAPSVVVGHSCVLSWWRAVKKGPAPAEWSVYREHVEDGLAGADVVVAPTHAMLAALDRHYGPFAATRVIPNGRNPDGLRPGSKERLVLAAGRLWDEAKNVTALEAVAADIDARVVLAGAIDAKAPAAPNVERLGALSPEALAEWMGRAAVYAHPARYEPFGLAVLEAALAGCALVLGDIDSLRENWDGAACFVDPDDRTALRRAIAHLLDDRDARTRLARAAHARAVRLDARRMVNAYLDLYADLLAADEMPLRVEEGSSCAS